jgi:hypothetical protein
MADLRAAFEQSRCLENHGCNVCRGCVCALLDDVLEALEGLTEALEEIERWSHAYPLSVFPEPDLVKTRGLLEAGGMTLDAVSAHAMRHVVVEVGEMARRALSPTAEAS